MSKHPSFQEPSPAAGLGLGLGAQLPDDREGVEKVPKHLAPLQASECPQGALVGPTPMLSWALYSFTLFLLFKAPWA